MVDLKQFTIDAPKRGVWEINFRNPPINVFTPASISEFHALVAAADADDAVKVIVFGSADPDFFIAHFDVPDSGHSPQTEGADPSAQWIDAVQRLSRSSVVSIAKIRGRARGVGNEFLLACDMRFGSRERAVLSNPEIGVGLLPGGGALEWLPRAVGRGRALEIVLSGDDFSADIAAQYGWINRAVADEDLDGFVERLAARLASFDRQALGAIKAQVNRFTVPSKEDMESSAQLFWRGLATPSAGERRAKLRRSGYGVRSDFEMRFGERVPELRPDTNLA
jgi:enoyl-CoA hydratase/carnithine racemase